LEVVAVMMVVYFVLLRWVVAWYEYWGVEMSWQLASSFLRGKSSVRGVNDKKNYEREKTDRLARCARNLNLSQLDVRSIPPAQYTR
jgi:hypothetical protein